MFMDDREKFIELPQAELKRRGYDCTRENDEIKVSKNGFPVTDILGGGEYRVYRNTLNDSDYHSVRAVYESLSEAYSLYEKGEPLAAQPRYRKLCEFGNYLIAARPMGYGYMEFVTWQQDAERTRVDVGHYTADYEAAKEDFAVRCGLVSRDKLFSETEMKLIRQGLVYLGANFPDLTYEQNTLLGKAVEKIEMIVPEIQEHEESERGELMPDDELAL
jgi:hypothetical protein